MARCGSMWLRTTQATAALALPSTHQDALRSQATLLAHNTSSLLFEASVWFWFGLFALPLTPPPFCVYHKPVLLKVAPSGYKNVISAYIKKMWLSGAAGNQKHPYKTPGPSAKVVPAKFLVALSFRGHRGSPRPLGAAPGL